VLRTPENFSVIPLELYETLAHTVNYKSNYSSTIKVRCLLFLNPRNSRSEHNGIFTAVTKIQAITFLSWICTKCSKKLIDMKARKADV